MQHVHTCPHPPTHISPPGSLSCSTETTHPPCKKLRGSKSAPSLPTHLPPSAGSHALQRRLALSLPSDKRTDRSCSSTLNICQRLSASCKDKPRLLRLACQTWQWPSPDTALAATPSLRFLAALLAACRLLSTQGWLRSEACVLAWPLPAELFLLSPRLRSPQ